jgi:hypothetical protein
MLHHVGVVGDDREPDAEVFFIGVSIRLAFALILA